MLSCWLFLFSKKSIVIASLRLIPCIKKTPLLFCYSMTPILNFFSSHPKMLGFQQNKYLKIWLFIFNFNFLIFFFYFILFFWLKANSKHLYQQFVKFCKTCKIPISPIYAILHICETLPQNREQVNFEQNEFLVSLHSVKSTLSALCCTKIKFILKKDNAFLWGNIWKSVKITQRWYKA